MSGSPARVAAIRAAYQLRVTLESLALESAKQAKHAEQCAEGLSDGEVWDALPLTALAHLTAQAHTRQLVLTAALEALRAEVSR